MKSKLFRMFALLIVISMMVTPVYAQSHNPPTINGSAQPVDKLQAVSPDEVIKLDEPATYIVLFEGQSLVAKEGGAMNLDAKSASSTAYLNSLAVTRENVLAQAASVLGHKLEIKYVYDVILNGVSTKLTPAEAEVMATVPGVRKVLRNTIETIDTDSGPSWIGAPTLWDGSAVPDEMGTKGEGVLVGILDTGINFDHPSFSATPADGYTYPAPAKFLGVCDPTNVEQYDPAYATACNNKLIGAYSYTRDSEPITPEDEEGHGSHTASTTAGNTVAMDFYGFPLTISGVAPHAQIIAYDVCYPNEANGACEGDDSVAAVQQAILDGVDVINYSISGGNNPYSDAVELAFLEATNTGMVVSTSAGNSGPTAATVAHRSPWLLSTAASTHDRKFTSIVNFSNPTYTNIVTLSGQIPFTTAVTDAPVKWSNDDNGNLLGCNAFTAGYFTGSIALIQRGTCTFSTKILNAQAAGAMGVLLYTDSRDPGAMSVSGTSIPAVMLDIPGATGTAIGNWVHGATSPTVSITAFGIYHNNAFGDITASFSSRGPNTTFDVLKPDVAAPGVEILAAVSDSTITPSATAEYNLMQGTSMASPHDAGSAALLKALHPTWTPSMIKSALMLTANDVMLKQDKVTPADPFDIGAGRVALQYAGLTGLVMNETYARYVAADPAAGGDVKTLNIPSVYNSQCVGQCSWTRTFTSVADLPATYTVSAPAWITVNPATFTINPGASQTITITADVSAFAPDAWQFATIDFNTTDTFSDGVTTLLSEGFESTTFPPTGWTRFNLDASASQWARSTAQFHSGAASAYHTYGSSTVTEDGWLVSPTVALGTNSFLKFWERSSYPADYDGGHQVYVCDTTGGTDCSTPPTNYVLAADIPQLTNTSWRQNWVGLSAYASKTVQIAFRYNAFYADGWYIDDVAVVDGPAGAAISDVHIPAAVLPTASNLPALVKFESHRDAGAATLSDLVAVGITDLTVDTYGFVKGQQTTIHLAQDPTNGSAYDDLSQVWYTVIPMDAGAARVVAEITASSAPDVDLFWGFDTNFDGKPQSSEQYQASATATNLEYLSEVWFPAPFYDLWVLVQNWQGSGAPLDDITLSLGVVPYAPADPATMTVDGPTSNPAGTPFSLDVYWHDLQTVEGDRLYGLFDAYTDSTYAQEIGYTQVDVKRLADDVVKTADVTSAQPGDTITYTITINNPNPVDLTYTIEDAIPAGTTYVDGSATNGAVYDAVNNKITWSGLVPGASFRDYVMTTSATDAGCAMPLANSGAYVNLNGYGLAPSAGVSGEGLWNWNTTGDPISFYGQNVGNTIRISDNAAAYFGTAALVSGANADIPDPAAPNNLMAFFWRDLVINYDAATVKGVTLANLTSGGVPVAHIIEMDDVSLQSDATKTYDTEMYISKAVDDTPGEYEIVFAYDNINGPLDIGTIGVENDTGTIGTKYAYNDAALGAITNGMAICFDYQIVPPPATVITFQVMLTDTLAPTLTNTAVHDNDGLGTLPEEASVTIDTPSGFPQAVDDTYNVLANGVLTVAAPGVLTNDVFASNDGHAVALVTAPLHGVLSLNADGSFIYTPETGYVGTDTFVYELVTYPGAKAPWTDQATVTITVNPLPIYLPIIFR